RPRLLVANVDTHALVRRAELFHHPDCANRAGLLAPIELHAPSPCSLRGRGSIAGLIYSLNRFWRIQLIDATRHPAWRRCCMKGYHRKGYRRRSVLETTRVQILQRWEDGLSMLEIAQALRVREKRVRSIITACGGIKPAQRCRSERVLSA